MRVEVCHDDGGSIYKDGTNIVGEVVGEEGGYLLVQEETNKYPTRCKVGGSNLVRVVV